MTRFEKELRWDEAMNCFFVSVYELRGERRRHIGTRHLTVDDRRDFAPQLEAARKERGKA